MIFWLFPRSGDSQKLPLSEEQFFLFFSSLTSPPWLCSFLHLQWPDFPSFHSHISHHPELHFLCFACEMAKYCVQRLNEVCSAAASQKAKLMGNHVTKVCFPPTYCCSLPSNGRADLVRSNVVTDNTQPGEGKMSTIPCLLLLPQVCTHVKHETSQTSFHHNFIMIFKSCDLISVLSGFCPYLCCEEVCLPGTTPRFVYLVFSVLSPAREGGNQTRYSLCDEEFCLFETYGLKGENRPLVALKGKARWPWKQ